MYNDYTNHDLFVPADLERANLKAHRVWNDEIVESIGLRLLDLINSNLGKHQLFMYLNRNGFRFFDGKYSTIYEGSYYTGALRVYYNNQTIELIYGFENGVTVELSDCFSMNTHKYKIQSQYLSDLLCEFANEQYNKNIKPFVDEALKQAEEKRKAERRKKAAERRAQKKAA